MIPTLRVVYRFAPQHIGLYRPEHFDKQVCLGSLLNAVSAAKLAGVRVHTTLLLVGEVGESSASLTDVDETLHLGPLSNAQSLLAAWKYAKASSSSEDLVLLAEDDYLWQPLSLVRLAQAASELGPGAVLTPHEHPDRYQRTDDLDRRRHQLFLAGRHRWITVESTCMTFMVHRSDMRRIDASLELACAGTVPRDRAMFRALVFGRVFKLALFALRHKKAQALLPCLRVLVDVNSRKRVRVVMSIPSLADHIDSRVSSVDSLTS